MVGDSLSSRLCLVFPGYPLIKLIGLCLAPSIDSASRNLLRLRRKARCARLSPPADSRAFGARARASRSISLAPSALALALRARFPRAFGARFLCQLPRIESLTKTRWVTAGEGVHVCGSSLEF